MRRFFIATALLLLQTTTWASGIVTIVGKVDSLTQSEVRIASETALYTVKRSAISPAQTRQLERAGATVNIAVPFNAIVKIKSKTASITKSGG